MFMMIVMKDRRFRGLRAFVCFLGAMTLLGITSVYEVRWIDPVFISLELVLILVLSIRTLVKWRSSGTHDVTKHGPMAVWPGSWRRWFFDEHSAGS